MTDGPRERLSRHLLVRLAEPPMGTGGWLHRSPPATLAAPSGAQLRSETLGPYWCLLCTLAKCPVRVPGAGGGQDSHCGGRPKARGPWTNGVA